MTAALIGGDKFFEEILKFSPRGTYSGGAVCYTYSGGWWKKNKKIFVLEGFLRWMQNYNNTTKCYRGGKVIIMDDKKEVEIAGDNLYE